MCNVVLQMRVLHFFSVFAICGVSLPHKICLVVVRKLLCTSFDCDMRRNKYGVQQHRRLDTHQHTYTTMVQPST